MKKIIIICTLFAITYSNDLLVSPALTDDALSVAVNPAGLATYRGANLAIVSSFRPESSLFAGISIKGLGLGLKNNNGTSSYSLADGFRINPKVYCGMRLSYVKATAQSFYNYDMGFMVRPIDYVSIGANTENLVSGGDEKRNVSMGAAARIFDFVTLGMDVVYDGAFKTPKYNADLALGGINLSAKADFKTSSFWAGLTVSMANAEAGFMYPFGESKDKFISL